jgi:hypothetical protein
MLQSVCSIAVASERLLDSCCCGMGGIGRKGRPLTIGLYWVSWECSQGTAQEQPLP